MTVYKLNENQNKISSGFLMKHGKLMVPVQVFPKTPMQVDLLKPVWWGEFLCRSGPGGPGCCLRPVKGSGDGGQWEGSPCTPPLWERLHPTLCGEVPPGMDQMLDTRHRAGFFLHVVLVVSP